MNNIIKIISSFDTYGTLFNFTINRELKFKTLTGGIITVLTFLFIFYTCYLFGQDFFFRRNPKTSMEEIIPFENGRIKISNKNLTIAWRIEDAYRRPIKISQDLLFPVITYVSYSDFGRNIVQNPIKKNIPIKKCNEVKNINEYDFMIEDGVSLNSLKTNDWNCIDFDFDIFHLGGKTKTSAHEFFELSLNTCEINNNQKICVDINQLEKFLDHKYISILYPKSHISFTDTEEPFKVFYYNHVTHLNLNFVKKDSLVLNEEIFSDDKSWIFDSVMNYTGLSFKYLKNMYYFRDKSYYTNSTDDVYDENKIFYSFSFYLDKNHFKYFRSFMKFQDLLAIVGGFVKIVQLIISHIYNKYNKFSRDKFLINFLFENGNKNVNLFNNNKSLYFVYSSGTNQNDCNSPVNKSITKSNLNNTKNNKTRKSINPNLVRIFDNFPKKNSNSNYNNLKNKFIKENKMNSNLKNNRTKYNNFFNNLHLSNNNLSHISTNNNNIKGQFSNFKNVEIQNHFNNSNNDSKIILNHEKRINIDKDNKTSIPIIYSENIKNFILKENILPNPIGNNRNDLIFYKDEENSSKISINLMGNKIINLKSDEDSINIIKKNKFDNNLINDRTPNNEFSNINNNFIHDSDINKEKEFKSIQDNISNNPVNKFYSKCNTINVHPILDRNREYFSRKSNYIYNGLTKDKISNLNKIEDEDISNNISNSINNKTHLFNNNNIIVTERNCNLEMSNNNLNANNNNVNNNNNNFCKYNNYMNHNDESKYEEFENGNMNKINLFPNENMLNISTNNKENFTNTNTIKNISKSFKLEYSSTRFKNRHNRNAQILNMNFFFYCCSKICKKNSNREKERKIFIFDYAREYISKKLDLFKYLKNLSYLNIILELITNENQKTALKYLSQPCIGTDNFDIVKRGIKSKNPVERHNTMIDYFKEACENENITEFDTKILNMLNKKFSKM
jgi:hypothetical protein